MLTNCKPRVKGLWNY